MTRAADGGEESDVGFRTWHAEVPPTGLMDRLIHPFNEVQIRGWMRRSLDGASSTNADGRSNG